MESKTFKVAGLLLILSGLAFFYLGYVEEELYLAGAFVAVAVAMVASGVALMLKKDEKKSEKEEADIAFEPTICPNCKSEVVSAGKFCGNCGAPLGER